VTSTERSSADVRPLLDEMLAVAREGVARAGWQFGDPDEKLLLPVIGALTVFFGERLHLDRAPVDEEGVRADVARELREAASRHPAGTARHGAFLEAARMAERGAR